MRRWGAVALLVFPLGGAAPSLVAQDAPAFYPRGNLSITGARSIAFAPNGRLLAVGSKAGDVFLVDIEAGTVVRRIRVGDEVGSINFVPGGDAIFAVTRANIYVVDVVTGLVRVERRREASGWSMDVAGTTVAVVGRNGGVVLLGLGLEPVLDAAAKELYNQHIAAVLVGRGGDEVAAVSSEGVVAVWRRDAPSPLRVGHASREKVDAAARDPEGELIVTSSTALILTRDRTTVNSAGMGVRRLTVVRAVEWLSGRTLREFESDDARVQSLAVSPGRGFVLAGDENGIRVLGLGGGGGELRVATTRAPVALAISGMGEWVAALLEDGTIETWQTTGLAVRGTSGGAIASETVLPSAKYQVAPSGSLIAGALREGTVAVLAFEHRGVSEEIGQSVTDLVAGRLAASGRVEVVERAAVEQVLREMQFQSTGVTSPATAAQLGRILNARYVLLGAVNAFGATLVITVRVVETETARVVTAQEVTCNVCRMEELPRAVALLIEGILGR